MLRDAFAGTARPAPSPYFDSKLRAALAEERRRRRAARARMRIMQAYWVIAGVACLAIVAMLPWSTWPATARLPLVVVTIVLAVPLTLVRADLFELILGSAERLRGQV